MASERAFTSGHDRLAERSVIIAIVALLAGVTGLSIWAQHSTAAGSQAATAHVRALQAAQISASELAAATTGPAERRAVARAGERLAALVPSAGVRAAREALAAEPVSYTHLTLPTKRIV